MARKKEISPRPNPSEIKILELMWKEDSPLPAREIARLAAQRYGWNKNTTYTLLSSLVEKGCLRREDPGFVCLPLVERQQVRMAEAKSLIDRLFDGSPGELFSAFCQEDALSAQELAQLRELVEQYSRRHGGEGSAP